MSATDSTFCTYCHAAVAGEAPSARCPLCAAPHHEDCWTVNGGCARTGCAGGRVTLEAASVAPATSEATVLAGVEAPAEPDRRAYRQTVAILAASVLTILVAVGGALVVVGGGDRGPGVVPASAQAAQTLPAVVPPTTTPEEAEPSRAERRGDPREASRAQVRAAIRRVLVRQHRAAAGGDWHRAFALLSRRKRAAKEAAAGRPGDAAAGAAEYQRLIAPLVQGLQPDELEIAELDIDGTEAMVSISIPHADGTCYAGTTWLVFKRRAGWRFDPGFEDRPEREGADPLTNHSGPC